MWWGSTPKGNPNEKKSKLTKKFHQLLQIFDATLHLLLSPLPLHTVAVLLVGTNQDAPTTLQLLNDSGNQVHPVLHIRSPTWFLGASLFKLHAQPVVAQPLDFGINVSQNRLETACRRHGNAQTSTKTASDSIDSLSAFKRIASANHIPA